jgi:hypothetical protein
MKKYLAVAVTGAMALGVVSFASGDESVQKITSTITPKTLPRTTYENVTLRNDIRTFPDRTADPNTDQPPSADRTIVDFPTNMKFNTNSVPKCKVGPAGLEGTSTAQAKQKCGLASQVSIDGVTKSHAHVTVDVDKNNPNSNTVPIDAVVTAFNGKLNAAGQPTIYLHAKTTGQAAALPPNILVGKLIDSPLAGYGSRLDVTVPDLNAGAIDDFLVTVKNGKYIQSRCNVLTNNFRAQTFYENHVPTVDTYSTTCTRG